jgi:hypothetical protein
MNQTECLREVNRKYYEKYKTQTLKRKAEKITCECGATICIGGISIHKRSQKHIKYFDKL